GARAAGPPRLGAMATAGETVESLIRWLQAATDLLQTAAASRDFFDRAAGALVDLVGLDAGRVLLRDKGRWRVQGVRRAPALVPDAWQPSRQVLARVLEEKRTFWQVPPTSTGSLCDVDALVAAPILDRAGEVIGVLYGTRALGALGPRGAGPITRLEAMLAELLAGGVATGLARLEQEEAALAGQKKGLQMQRDLEIGRGIQAGVLPEAPAQGPGLGLGAP